MYCLLYLFSLYSLVSCNFKHNSIYYSNEFNKYLSKYNTKFQSKEEYEYRLKIFSRNLDEIEEVNSKHTNFRLGLTPFVHLTKEEFKSTHSSPLNTNKQTLSSLPYITPHLKLMSSESVDWRAQGKVSSVKDQDECGACYAFSGASAMESKHAIINGTLYDLSVQQLIDCSYKQGFNDGCNGGSAYYVWEYAAKYKYLCTEDEYPYANGLNSVCYEKYCKRIENICTHSGRVKSDENSLKTIVSVQPVSVAIRSDSLQFYNGGIYDGECIGDINHAVLVVGYGSDENGIDYWIIKNSWGLNWGENGYLRLIRNDGSKYGRCDVASEGLIPLTSGEYPIKGMDLKQYLLVIVICIIVLLILCECIHCICVKVCNRRRRRRTHENTVNISTIPIIRINDNDNSVLYGINNNNNNNNNPVVVQPNNNPSVFVTATSFSDDVVSPSDDASPNDGKKEVPKITTKLFSKGYSKLK